MNKIIKCEIDDELENGIKKLDDKDAYRFGLICSEHVLNTYKYKNNLNINKALQVINNNLDNVDKETAKYISLTINQEALKTGDSNLVLYYLLKAFSHTVGSLYNKENALYAAIYSATAMFYKENKEAFEKEKLYQLEKLNRFLLLYEELK